MASLCPPHHKGAPTAASQGAGLHLLLPPLAQMEKLRSRVEKGFLRSQRALVAPDCRPGVALLAQASPIASLFPYQLAQRLQPLPRVFDAIGLDEVVVFV